MFRIKHVSFDATIVPKPPKINNVPINAIDAITTHNQQLKHVFKEREQVKAKGVEDC
jgi:hypothetical protein